MLKINEIHELIKRIDESSIDEFTFETNETKLSLKKHKGEVETMPQKSNPVVTTSTTSVDTANNGHQIIKEDSDFSEEKETVKNYDHEIVSPMVGTFYSSPSPDKDVFVKNGEKVNKDTVVCIVEAMKLFNEIEADIDGEIVDVLVGNGELVEYGQPLFRVKTV
ncbi:acetyl-CoA carboxylase biotin carboxyl carrier protein [Aquibacillus rhizosphaerae]|uniref:Biotin carboxyl carrier protein of acetyl-CoA carboxylase n=1 Tax=Aquibacillus rhizosphaerae TaxID=3051431 RepID=A0ABT7L6U8_9BACI|nr:acetyl-CoA carboxylase biotin carboxyl carrier protein [Aquibacillus sp. LR5S19]MDL4841589.1 acetyl-CoA carboxylase biotin carboxyl carrier protein [Aquibacillus sp. LR5S19]